MAKINLNEVVRILREQHGISATVENTGGGTATLYAGPVVGDRYAAVGGPGVFDNMHGHTADTSDFYVGPDDDGATDVPSAAELDVVTEDQVAELIASTVRERHPD